MSDALRQVIERWREDPGGTYRSWFLWEERLKNFRSIRRGISTVIQEIAAGTFGTAYRGSSLETVVGSIAEQRQIFKGADHAFLWKPKLRITAIPTPQWRLAHRAKAVISAHIPRGFVRVQHLTTAVLLIPV